MRLRSATVAQDPSLRMVAGQRASGTIRPGRRSVSRAVYLVLLALCAALALRFLVGAAMFAEAPGVVDRGEVAVGVERTGRTERLLVAPGEEVRRGDVLAVISVLAERTAAQQSRREAERLLAEAEAEIERAAARARERSASTLAEVARLRDDALRARAEAAQATQEIDGLGRQVGELDAEVAAREELQRQEVLARTALVDLRVRRHELLGRRDGLRARRDILEHDAFQLEAVADRLEREALDAPEEALRASSLASLRARADQLDAEARQHDELASQTLTAPFDGRVAWLEVRAGEVVQPGQPVVTLVPGDAPTVVAWAGAQLESFSVGARVRVRGEGFETTGAVERILVADRAKPRTLLRPYEHEAVGPTVLVRLDATDSEAARAGSVVTVLRPRLSFLERWLVPEGGTEAPVEKRTARR